MRDEREPKKLKVVGAKTIRLDGNTAGVSAEGAQGNLLDLFRTWIQKGSRDRRNAPRHPAADYRIWLGWWRGEEAFFANPARLINVSRGGALITVLNPPPEGHSAWICLGEPEPRECLEVSVLEVRTARRRECYVRLAFSVPCPTSFFEAAVCIATPPRRRKETAFEAEDDDR